MSKYQACIFDFDGVLVDSEPLHARAWQLILEQRGIAVPLQDFYEGIGVSSPVFVAQLEQKYALQFSEGHRAVIDRKRALYEQLARTEMRPIAGVPEYLRQLSAQAALAICSSSVIRSVGLIVKQFGWEKYFAAIVTSDQVKKPKPDPALYQETLRQLALPAQRALVFEDSPVGVQSARAAGIDVIGIASYFPPQQLRAAGALDVAADFNDPKLHFWRERLRASRP